MLLLSLGIHTHIGIADDRNAPGTESITTLEPQGKHPNGERWLITSQSGSSEIALAKHH